MSESLSTWASNGFKIQLFGKGRNAIQSKHANDLVDALNMLGKITIKKGSEDKVFYAENGVVIQLKDLEHELIGSEFENPFRIYQSGDWLTYKVTDGFAITTGDPITVTNIETEITITSGVAYYWFYLEMTATTAEVKSSATTLVWSNLLIPIGWVDTYTNGAYEIADINQMLRDNVFNPCAT